MVSLQECIMESRSTAHTQNHLTKVYTKPHPHKNTKLNEEDLSLSLKLKGCMDAAKHAWSSQAQCDCESIIQGLMAYASPGDCKHCLISKLSTQMLLQNLKN